MKYLKQTIAALVLLPYVAYAQLTDTGRLIDRVGYLIGRLTIVVGAIALLVFFWGLVKFISKAGGETGIEEGKNIMKWGILALFVMISIWGIIRFMQSELNLRNFAPMQLQVPGQGGGSGGPGPL